MQESALEIKCTTENCPEWCIMYQWEQFSPVHRRKIMDKTFTPDILHIFNDKKALLTAGTGNDFNTMLIGWGALGTMWFKPAATVYVRESRYTKEFMDKQDIFTISFFDEKYMKDEMILGTKSGRDGDKIALTSLTPVKLETGVTFKEAEATLVCKKLYHQEMDISAMPEDIVKSNYAQGNMHTMYIGEVIDVLR